MRAHRVLRVCVLPSYVCSCLSAIFRDQDHQGDARWRRFSQRKTYGNDRMTCRTPVPWLADVLVIACRTFEPLALTLILGYIVRLLAMAGVTHGNDEDIGFYASILEGCFMASSSVMGARRLSGSMVSDSAHSADVGAAVRSHRPQASPRYLRPAGLALVGRLRCDECVLAARRLSYPVWFYQWAICCRCALLVLLLRGK